MKNIRFFCVIALLVLHVNCLCAEGPNILIILADDLGFGDLSINNPKSKIQTPHLDRLARQGMNFIDAHSPSGVCSPTRYGLLTGRYAWRTRLKRGVLNGTSEPLIEKNRLTLPMMLKELGYQNGHFGKWHLGRRWAKLDASKKLHISNIDWSQPAIYCALDAGFTYAFELAQPAWAFMENRRLLAPPTEAFDLTHLPVHIIGGNNNKGYRQPGFTFEKMLPKWVEKACTFIDQSAQKEEPFFVYFAPICPHRPIRPNNAFLGKSACGVFGDFVVELDDAVGRLLSQIERSGIRDETLVFFTSDNGAETNTYQHIQSYDHWSSGGKRGCKRDLYEGGHRVPFIAKWHGKIPAGTTSSEIICLTDLMATIASIVDYKLPQNSAEDSYDMSPALFAEQFEKPIRDAIVHHSGRGKFAIRQGDWVYVDAPSGSDNREPQSVLEHLGVVPHNEKAELFDLRKDPNQSTNRIAQNAEIASKLKQLLMHFQNEASSKR